jgi:uncharacterized protein YceK
LPPAQFECNGTTNKKEKRMKKTSIAVIAAILLSGCASVVNDKTHPMKIETKTEAGQLVAGADCTIKNDKATGAAKSGEITNVRRSNADLEVSCKHPANPEATAKAISRVNSGMFGNIILGGGIGAIIDHNTGNAYTYPAWIQLVFGKTLIFDRRNEKANEPVPPTPDAAASAPAPSPRLPT